MLCGCLVDKMWHPLSDVREVLADCDLRLAVIDRNEVHELSFPCRRVGFTWVASHSRKPVAIYPSHWQWRDDGENAYA
jgi:hypothetical protein